MYRKQDFINELEQLPEQDFESLARIIGAWKRSRDGTTAFIEQLLNVDFLGFDEKKNVYQYKMLITDELKNRIHTLHGGITATYVDITMGHSLLVEFGPDLNIVTLDLSIRYLSPGLKGWIVSEIEVIKKGKTILTLEAKIWDEQQKLIAAATGTFFRTE